MSLTSGTCPGSFGTSPNAGRCAAVEPMPLERTNLNAGCPMQGLDLSGGASAFCATPSGEPHQPQKKPHPLGRGF